MNRLREVFSEKKHVFLAVIHVVTHHQALRNTAIARENGADGVFLISHLSSLSTPQLLNIYGEVRREYRDWWIGLNLLRAKPLDAIEFVPPGASGLWMDNPGINEESPDPAEEARATWRAREKREDWKGLLFGGVAFKGQPAIRDLGRITSLAASCMDVITTSGEATGEAPNHEKVAMIKDGAGRTPVVIASGMTPGNISSFLDVSDGSLVATGISQSWTELDPAKVRTYAETILG